jgi:hypothetical protein
MPSVAVAAHGTSSSFVFACAAHDITYSASSDPGSHCRYTRLEQVDDMDTHYRRTRLEVDERGVMWPAQHQACTVRASGMVARLCTAPICTDTHASTWPESAPVHVGHDPVHERLVARLKLGDCAGVLHQALLHRLVHDLECDARADVPVCAARSSL